VPDSVSTAGPLVSVVIPSYNSGRFLRQAIDSALAQTYPHVEVIVVDDGSTDDTPEIIRSYSGRVHGVTQANAGLAAARNSGIRAGRGAHFAFLDADDWWAPAFAARMVEALRLGNAGIAYCGWQNVGLLGARGEPFVPPDYERDPDKLVRLLEGVRWPVHAAMVRRDVVESVGGFDSARPACEDFAFWIRTATRFPLVRVPEVLAFYRHHAEQMTKNRASIARNFWEVQREFLARHPDVVAAIGKERARKLTDGELLRRGYEQYWARDFEAARATFRMVMRTGYGSPKDWLYMLPSVLPLALHRALVRTLGDRARTT
jgi:glycosyltransferase involved in cell wall biosynthesis